MGSLALSFAPQKEQKQILVVAVRFGDDWVPKLLIFIPKVKSSKEGVTIFRSSAHFSSFLASASSECPYLFWRPCKLNSVRNL